MYLGLDGTGVPVCKSEVQGRRGKQPDGSAKTREVKLVAVWTAEGRDKDGLPVRDPGSVSYSAAVESAASRDTDRLPSPLAQRAHREARRRGFDTAPRRVVLGDGAEWIRMYGASMAGRASRSASSRALSAAAERYCAAGRHGIFVSLSDNIQETFGLTPVEAMAAGLPCVVSDWNGYKDTVADGETGFRIPTTTLGPGAGIDVADRHAAGVDSYDQLIGITSLATAVDVDACADAIARLAGDAALRARLGQAAAARARRLYDWRVVVAAYQRLCDVAVAPASQGWRGLRDVAVAPRLGE